MVVPLARRYIREAGFPDEPKPEYSVHVKQVQLLAEAARRQREIDGGGVWTLFKNAVKGEDGSFNQLKEWSEEIHDDNKTVVGLVDRARRAGPEKLPAEEPED